MKSITINFYPEIYENLKKHAEDKKISINQYVRSLVDLGLRIEEMSGQPKENLPSNGLDILQKIAEKNLISTQEILYLARYIVTHLPQEQVSHHSEMLSQARVRSEGFVEALVKI